MWTSRQVWDMSVFKYTYPELVGVNASVEDHINTVREHLARNYFSRFPRS